MKPELYLSHPDAQFWADFSFVDFSDGYLDSMSESISKALASMKELESGAIANPDENRMVGHYWLRDADLAPNDELSRAIRETLAKVKEVAQACSFRLSPVPTRCFYRSPCHRHRRFCFGSSVCG
jgi:glucose-6-phosphate isomerase